MRKFKNFNVDEAEKLRLEYEENQCYDEEEFIRALIAYQTFLPNNSIVARELTICYYFNKNTIQNVLEKLKYTLVSYDYSERIYDICTNLFFIPQNLAEG